MNSVTRVGPGGRIVIPSAVRKSLCLSEGDELLITEENGEIRLISRKEALKRARMAVSRHVPAEVSLVDELIAERRRDEADT